jgi:Tol biopolymer transport system component
MINVAPRWHTQAPMIFFSQLTKENNRLMALDLNSKKPRIISSYEGLNMHPSFSEDGSKSVLCLSGRKNSELYLYDQKICNKLKKKVYIQLTHNEGNNASPCLLPNGNVVFCSDYETGNPQIPKTNKCRALQMARVIVQLHHTAKQIIQLFIVEQKKIFFNFTQ